MASLESVFAKPNFSERDNTTDVCFTVEDQPIFFSKTLLVISSPVFARMFDSDFKEKEQEEIPLPEKGYDEFLTFLMQLHPAYAWFRLSAESVEPLLKLADEYDTIHIKRKCTHFIHTQMQTSLSRDEVMRYLWLSEVYQLTELQTSLLVLAADHTVEQLEACRYYTLLQDSTKMSLIKARCIQLEDEKEDEKRSLIETERALRKLKSIVDRLPGLIHTLPKRCCTHCFICPNKKNPCFEDDSTRWCSCRDRQKHVSYLQVSYCKSCVMRKAGTIVSKLASLLQSVTSIQSFLSQTWVRVEVTFYP